MTTDERIPSRRMVLGAFAGFGAIAGVPIAAVARIEERAANRRPWNLALAELDRAHAEHAAAERAFNSVQAAWEIGRPSIEMIDWKVLSFRDREHMARSADVEQEWQEFLQAEGKLWWSANPAAAKARHRAALDSVLEFRRQEAEHDARHGYSAAYDRLERAAEDLTDAEQVLMDMPAPDQEALLWKLEHASAAADPIITDARRLLAAGRA